MTAYPVGNIVYLKIAVYSNLPNIWLILKLDVCSSMRNPLFPWVRVRLGSLVLRTLNLERVKGRSI